MDLNNLLCYFSVPIDLEILIIVIQQLTVEIHLCIMIFFIAHLQRRHSLGILSAGLTERNSGDKFDCKQLTDWFQNKWNGNRIRVVNFKISHYLLEHCTQLNCNALNIIG